MTSTDREHDREHDRELQDSAGRGVGVGRDLRPGAVHLFHFRHWPGHKAQTQSVQGVYRFSPSPTRQLSTSNVQPTDHTSDTAMGESGIDRLARALGLGSGSGSGQATDKSSSRPFKKKDVPSLAQYIQSDACKKVHLMVSLILYVAMCGFLSLISVR